MNKKEFLDKLRREVRDEQIVTYYDELVSDRIEAGESESSVVAGYDVDKILRSLQFENTRKELEQISKKEKKGKGWIVMLALFTAPVSYPIAFALGLAFIIIVLTFFIVAAAFIVAGVAGLFWIGASVWELIALNESVAYILFCSGEGFVALGLLGVIGYYALKWMKVLYNWTVVRFFGFSKRRKAKEAVK